MWWHLGGFDYSQYHMAIPYRHKTIAVRPQQPDVATAISAAYSLSPVTSRILAARGFSAGDALSQYLNPSLREGLPNPSGLLNLDRAIALIQKEVDEGNGIAVCSDFDVDGLSGASQLYDFFSLIGVRVASYVPDRFQDGYGLNKSMIDRAIEEGMTTLIAVDFGTKNAGELQYAQSKGLTTIVIDHHDAANTSNPADAFINPQQDGCGFAGGILCASGLVWYFIASLRSGLSVAKDIDPRRFLDLACLGTICDMVPLTGANRVIASKGLEAITNTQRIGLDELKKVAGIKNEVQAHDVSFGIGPRINAAGRIMHGELVVKLFTSSDRGEARKLAEKLQRLNLERQDVEASVREQAVKLALADGIPQDGIAVWHPDFHTGVIGIVAQRLVEQFYRPAAVMGLGPEGVYKGSVRGIRGISVVELLAGLKPYLLSYGGHVGAGGFSVAESNIKSFCKAFAERCRSMLQDVATVPVIEVDTAVELREVSIDLVGEFQKFSPFGVGNSAPTLLIERMKVQEVRELRGGHLRVQLADNAGRPLSAVMWRTPSHPCLTRDAIVDVAFKPDVNSYLGKTEVQANIQAVASVD